MVYRQRYRCDQVGELIPDRLQPASQGIDRSGFHGWPWLAAVLFPVPWMVFWCWFWNKTELVVPWSGPADGLALLLATTCAATDLRDRKIRNWATYSGAIWAMALAAWGNLGPTIGMTYPTFADVGLGFISCFGLLLTLFMVFQGGAGDVKLGGALGALLGPGAGMELLIDAYLCAALAAIGFLGTQWVMAPRGKRQLAIANAWRGRIPLGPFFLMGLLLVWFSKRMSILP